MVQRPNPIAVICSNIFATCAVCGCLIGQQAVRQYKTGPNQADQWSMRFQSPISEPPNATWIFRTIYFCRGKSGMWRFGFRHSFLILLSVAAVVVTHRARLRALLSDHWRAGQQRIAHVAASDLTQNNPPAIRSGNVDCKSE